MSTFSLARGPRELLGAWETEGRIRYGALSEVSTLRTASGDAAGCKHPSIACNAAGEVLVAWIEVAGWGEAGTLSWRLCDAKGAELESGRGEEDGVPAWSLVQAVALADGRFAVLE
jgi:hypothetical protein